LTTSPGTNTSYRDKADAAGIITTEKGKKIKRGPTSLHIDLGLWQEVRIMAVLKGKSVTDYVEDALRRKIDADNLEAGRQGYHVGQGGMYIPPPPTPQKGTSPPPPTPQQPAPDKTVITYFIPGKFSFPTTKEKLVQYLEKFQKTGAKFDEKLALARRLPDDGREYNIEDLTSKLTRVARYKEGIIITDGKTGKPLKVVGVIVETELHRHSAAELNEMLKALEEKERQQTTVKH
jgi:hypothetical protein